MTTAAGRRASAVVVLTKPGTVASVAWAGIIILGAAVAAHTTDRVEADSAIRSGGLHSVYIPLEGVGVADVAGRAISVQHVEAMDVVEGACPVRAVA
jgi:hypothetical protein